MHFKHLSLNYQNNTYTLKYPDLGNTNAHLISILQGRTYPRVPVSTYTADFVIDIGANLGAASLYLNLMYNPKTMYCYEPSPSTFLHLESNLNFFSNVNLFNYGLGDSNCASKLFDGTSQSLQRSLIASAEVKTNAFENVLLKDASKELDFVKNKRGVLKIDTEGFEVVILNRIQNLLQSFDIIYLEFHSENDRRQIDSILSQNFDLWSASIQKLHRGDLAYISHRLINENPNLASWEIKRQQV